MSKNKDIDQIIEREDLGEDTVRFFVWSVWSFFKNTSGADPEIGTPYLFDKFKHSDYTGVIGVSGSQKGAVYVTMEKGLLEKAIAFQYPDVINGNFNDADLEEMRVDYAGEIANIISGNARNYLGRQFLISVPVVVTAPDTQMHIDNCTKGIIFPVHWNNTSCHIILCLEKNENNELAGVPELENAI